jgi:hypothetical protein
MASQAEGWNNISADATANCGKNRYAVSTGPAYRLFTSALVAVEKIPTDRYLMSYQPGSYSGETDRDRS